MLNPSSSSRREALRHSVLPQLYCVFPYTSQSIHTRFYASLPLLLKDDTSVTSTRACSPQRACSGVACTAASPMMPYFQGQAARLLLLSSAVATENQAQDHPGCLGRMPPSRTPGAAAGAFLLLCTPCPPLALSHGTTVAP